MQTTIIKYVKKSPPYISNYTKNIFKENFFYFSADDITSNLILCLFNCSIREVLPNAAPGVSTPPL